MELTERQMEIVNAAIHIMASRGYEKLTTKNLATEIGVTEAALYRHFLSKRELVLKVLCYFEHLSCEIIGEIRSSELSPLESSGLSLTAGRDSEITASRILAKVNLDAVCRLRDWS